MSAPVRIQRSRAKGWRMPPNTVYVGRPTRWGNLWRVGRADCGCRSAGECTHGRFFAPDAAAAVECYRQWLAAWKPRSLDELRQALRGKNLACWCPLDQPCHADVLLELANP